MYIVLNLESTEPLYQQIRNQIVEAVASGRLQPGDPLPATRALAAELAINYHTVNKAYELLVNDGFISLTRGRGAVVRSPLPLTQAQFRERWGASLRAVIAEAVAQGMTAEEILAACRETVGQFRSGGAPKTN